MDFLYINGGQVINVAFKVTVMVKNLVLKLFEKWNLTHI